jgi:hypothetical protein
MRMTSSHNGSSLKEQEMQAFWRYLREARSLFKLKGFCDELDEFRDEIEVIRLHTNWPRLQQMCDELLAREDWFVDPFDDVAADAPAEQEAADQTVLAG